MKHLFRTGSKKSGKFHPWRLSLVALFISSLFISLAGSFIYSPPKVQAANRAGAWCKEHIAKANNVDESKVPTNDDLYKKCVAGYNYGYQNPGASSAQKVCNQPSTRWYQSCLDGFAQGQKDKKAESSQPSAAEIQKAAESACQPYKNQDGVSSSDRTENFNACIAGYKGQSQTNPKGIDESCGNYSGPASAACIKGHDAAINHQTIVPGTSGGSETGESGGGSDPSNAGNSDLALGCDVNANALSWVICPVVDILAGFISVIDNFITNQMVVDTNNIFCSTKDTCDAYYGAWKSFRNIAVGLMVISGLVILIAQSLGIELLDAYTIRKTLPRFLIAAIAITLSWPLMEFFVNLTNALGIGIRHLIYAPFSALSNEIHFGDSAGNIFLGGVAIGGGAAVGAGALIFSLAGGIGAILAYMGTAALAVLIAFVVLALRQIVIIFTMLLAPIAIVCYILPNTQKVYNLWWDAFSKALLMFPLIAGFIAAGRVFSAIAIHAGGPFNQLIGFIAYFAPYFLIPLTFKFAGGFMRQLGGFVNDRSKGGFDRLRNFRAQRRERGRENLLAGNLYKEARAGSRQERLNKAWQSAGLGLSNTDSLGNNPMRWRSRAQMLRETSNKNAADKILQSDEFKPYLGDDDFGRAALLSGGSVDAFKRNLRETGKFSNEAIEEKAAGFELMQRKFGYSSLKQAALASSLMASTFLDPENSRGQLLDYIDIASEGRTQTEAQMIGTAKDIAPKNGRPGAVAPFSDMWGQLQAIKAASTPEAREAAIHRADEYLADVNTDVEGPAFWFTGKGRDTESGLPSIQRKIQRAAANMVAVENNNGRPVTVTRLNGDQEVLTEEQAHNEMIQVMAQVQATADNLKLVSPEKERLFKQGVMDQVIPGFKTTVRQNVMELSSDPETAERFKSSASLYEQEIARRQAQADILNPNNPAGSTLIPKNPLDPNL